MPCLVIEKKKYPFHRVCGEYISNETTPFLKSEGLYPEQLNPIQITEFQLSSVAGKTTQLPLSLGGFGISRFVFDNFLYEKAKALGVKFLLETEVESVNYKEGNFDLKTSNSILKAQIVVGSFGKRSKLDSDLSRTFFRKRSPYVGVKYHVRTQHPSNLIALHNFRGGYCGISNIEDGKTNLCYLTHRDNLKKFRGRCTKILSSGVSLLKSNETCSERSRRRSGNLPSSTFVRPTGCEMERDTRWA